MTLTRNASLTLTAVALAAAPAASADWLGKAEAGFVMARGNTDTEPGLQPEVTLSQSEW